MSNQTNGDSKSWGVIKEVEVTAIPPKFVPTRQSKWQGLYDELVLRLKETGPKFALAVPFEDRKAAEAAKSAVTGLIVKRLGAGYIRSMVRPNGKGWVLYVHRGPEYK